MLAEIGEGPSAIKRLPDPEVDFLFKALILH
jgi:hypothetical protein